MGKIIKEIRLYIAEMLMNLILTILPDSPERQEFALFILGYMRFAKCGFKRNVSI